MPGSRVFISESDLNFRRRLKDILIHSGYLIIGESSSGKHTLQMVSRLDPTLIILEHRLPGSEDLDIAEIIGGQMIAPVVLTVDARRQDVDELVRKTGVYGVLSRTLLEASILPVLETAIAGFERVTDLQKQVVELRKKLYERRLVEQAKGLLMESKGFTEEQAYRYMRHLSMDNCLPLAKIARNIVMAAQR